MSGCLEIVPPILWLESGETIGDDGPEFIDAPSRPLSEQSLELREGHLDRVKVRGVWWQELNRTGFVGGSNF